MDRIYAMYKGDEFLCEGTSRQICKQMGIKISTFRYYHTTHYIKNRDKGTNNRRMVYRIDQEDNLYNLPNE